ncbi:hypothetical protein C3Y92_05110 [Solidesulfovibrio carbinolicus]|uniref:Uncharacterized protein n=1 Tax=Solidesulfovibrio carbinolicus TaxID=296842 RepID=A0A4P6HJL2_9BACT|nr:hypothetical protein C3Y92_05110 [Solidesulfovibrio carbinolicus]
MRRKRRKGEEASGGWGPEAPIPPEWGIGLKGFGGGWLFVGWKAKETVWMAFAPAAKGAAPF